MKYGDVVKLKDTMVISRWRFMLICRLDVRTRTSPASFGADWIAWPLIYMTMGKPDVVYLGSDRIEVVEFP